MPYSMCTSKFINCRSHIPVCAGSQIGCHCACRCSKRCLTINRHGVFFQNFWGYSRFLNTSSLIRNPLSKWSLKSGKISFWKVNPLEYKPSTSVGYRDIGQYYRTRCLLCPATYAYIRKGEFLPWNWIPEVGASRHCYANHSKVETPVMSDPQRNMLYWRSRCIFHTVCLGVVGCEWGTNSVYFGITCVCFTLEYFLPLPWGPSIKINCFFNLWQKYHKIFKKNNAYNLNWVYRTNTDLVGNFFHSGFHSVALWYPLGSNLCKHAGGHSVATEACTSHTLCGMAVWKLIWPGVAMWCQQNSVVHCCLAQNNKSKMFVKFAAE